MKKRSWSQFLKHGKVRATVIGLAVVFIAHHCLMTLLLVAPQNPLTKHYQAWVSSYMLPYFPQVWLVYGPQFSGKNRKVYFKCKGSMEQQPWHDYFQPAIESAQRNRLSGREYILRLKEHQFRTIHNTYLEIRKQRSCSLATDSYSCIRMADAELAQTVTYRQFAQDLAAKCSQYHSDDWKQIDIRFAWQLPTPIPGGVRNLNSMASIDDRVEIETIPSVKREDVTIDL